jgi:small subunit ribosomal protein S30e
LGFSGKVHGSLARAGKVRGQTPKVAKQDKKKKPRGRAHKRMQYNRRFVTAVVGFGKKRGPNSSEKWYIFSNNTLAVQGIWPVVVLCSFFFITLSFFGLWCGFRDEFGKTLMEYFLSVNYLSLV